MPDGHVEEYVRENLRRGYTTDSIKEMLRVSGYDPGIVDKIMSERPSSSLSGFQGTNSSTNTFQGSTYTNNSTNSAPQGNTNMGGAFQKMSFIEKTKMIIFNPKGFFDIMPQAGGYKDPLIFCTVITIISTILSSVLSQALGLAVGKMANGIVSAMMSLIIGIILCPIVWATALSIGALVDNSMLRLFGGKGTYEATFRVLAYSTAMMLILWIPLAGFLTGIYQIYINLVGFRKVHSMTTGKVLAAMLIPIVVILIIVIIFAIVFGLAFLSILNGRGGA